jgi:protein SCO1/2
MRKLFTFGFLAMCLALCSAAQGQDLLNMKGTDRPDPLKNVGIDQKLDAQIPLDLPFRDDAGRDVKIGDFFGKRPVVLALVYYSCPMLCTQILNGMVSSLRAVTFNPGDEFEVVAVSFDARERPPLAQEKKQTLLKAYGRPQTAKGWHFLTGDLASIKALTSAAGFHYTYDAHTNQFAHASAIMVATPEGKLSKYYYGVEYSPKDLRLGLIEAAQNEIGTPVDQILLFCYHWDPSTGKYTPIAIGGLRIVAAATLVLICGFLFINFRRDARERASSSRR